MYQRLATICCRQKHDRSLDDNEVIVIAVVREYSVSAFVLKTASGNIGCGSDTNTISVIAVVRACFVVVPHTHVAGKRRGNDTFTVIPVPGCIPAVILAKTNGTTLNGDDTFFWRAGQ